MSGTIAESNGKRTNRPGEWMWINKEFIQSHAEHLTPAAIFVYLVLCMNSDNETQAVTKLMTAPKRFEPVSREAIARLANCSERNARRALDQLERQGLTEKTADGYRLREVTKLSREAGQKCHEIVTKMSPQVLKDSVKTLRAKTPSLNGSQREPLRQPPKSAVVAPDSLALTMTDLQRSNADLSAEEREQRAIAAQQRFKGFSATSQPQGRRGRAA
jgi:DNA-binding MarR family transcriptional regulator